MRSVRSICYCKYSLIILVWPHYSFRLCLVPTWVYKFVTGSLPHFIAQNLLEGTPKVYCFKFVNKNERRCTDNEIPKKNFDIYRQLVAFYL